VRSFRAQLKAIHRWGKQKPVDLASIHQPVLVMNGDSDNMVPTKNTVDLHDDSPTANSSSIPTPGTAACSSSTRTSSSGLWSSSERERS
jgi:pimeloyl-ACP methyl ester carboxylesterase